MRQYLIKRLGLFLPTAFILTVIVFVLMAVVPGDPALAILSEGEASYTQHDLKKLQKELGIDRPIDVQYFDWISGQWFAGKLRCVYTLGVSCDYDEGWKTVVKQVRDGDKHISLADARLIESSAQLGDELKIGLPAKIGGVVTGKFGKSFWFDAPVMQELGKRIPRTAQLAVMAIILATAFAIPLGILSAIRPDSWMDYGARTFTLAGISIPNFLLAILVLLFLIQMLGWYPPLGYVELWDDPVTNLKQMALPSIVLAFYDMAFIARVTRSSMMEVVREDYMRTARSKGLSERVVLIRHGLKNAILPVLTITGWQFGRLFEGTVIIETIFLIPGMGRILIDAVYQHDFPMIQAVIVIIGLSILTINLLVDLFYGWLDPRIRYN